MLFRMLMIFILSKSFLFPMLYNFINFLLRPQNLEKQGIYLQTNIAKLSFNPILMVRWHCKFSLKWNPTSSLIYSCFSNSSPFNFFLGFLKSVLSLVLAIYSFFSMFKVYMCNEIGFMNVTAQNIIISMRPPRSPRQSTNV